MAVTLRDVAERAGVAPSTASRALDPSRSASEQVRQRVNAAAEALGYQGNGFARGLRTNRSGVIGLLIPDVRNPFFTELAYEVERRAAEAGLAVMIGNADEQPHSQERYLAALNRVHVDGLLLVPQGAPSHVLLDAVGRRPTVCIDRDAGLGVPVVVSDSMRGMNALVDHVVALGHRRVAVISGPLATSTGQERLAAARDRLAEHGLELRDADVVEGDFQLASGIAAAHRILGQRDIPDVVIAADVLMATGLIRVARERGLRVGVDVGVAAFDDDPWFDLLDVPITAVAQDIPRLAQQAVTALVASLSGDEVEVRPVPTRLVVRASLGERAVEGERGAGERHGGPVEAAGDSSSSGSASTVHGPTFSRGSKEAKHG